LIEELGRQRQERNGRLLGIEIFVVQSRRGVLHAQALGDDDGDVKRNDYGPTQALVLDGNRFSALAAKIVAEFLSRLVAGKSPPDSNALLVRLRCPRAASRDEVVETVHPVIICLSCVCSAFFSRIGGSDARLLRLGLGLATSLITNPQPSWQFSDSSRR
jgi:hypothetical protein